MSLRNRETLGTLFCAALLMISAKSEAARSKVSHKSVARVTSSEFARQDDAGAAQLSAGLGLVFGGLVSGLSLNVGGVMRVSHDVPIYVGLDSFLTLGGGYTYLNYSIGSSAGVALLGTGYYDIQFPKKPRMHILAGVSAGPFIASGVRLAVLGRPGFRFDFSPAISITGEPAFGVVGSGFGVFPRALVSFKI